MLPPEMMRLVRLRKGKETRAARGTHMPQTPHVEKHFTSSETIRDIVIGMSDGLTVPFALAAGLSGAVDSTAIIITAGLAEVTTGSMPTTNRPARDKPRQRPR
jgi:ABC-type sulfate/molybdate transport systems ATPase subunit